jgi:hypothetical protein
MAETKTWANRANLTEASGGPDATGFYENNSRRRGGDLPGAALLTHLLFSFAPVIVYNCTTMSTHYAGK